MASAIRELHEETGLAVQPDDVRHLYTGTVDGETVVTYWAPDPGGQLVSSSEGHATWSSWLALTTGPFGAYNEAVRLAAVSMIPEMWVQEYGSGTLRRAIEEGMVWCDLYHHERAAMEYGFGFELVHRSRLTTGPAVADGDHPPTTETCWHKRALTYRAQVCGLDRVYRVVWARVDHGDSHVQEGLAIVCECPRPAWAPKGRVLLAFTTDDAGHPVNPC